MEFAMLFKTTSLASLGCTGADYRSSIELFFEEGIMYLNTSKSEGKCKKVCFVDKMFQTDRKVVVNLN